MFIIQIVNGQGIDSTRLEAQLLYCNEFIVAIPVSVQANAFISETHFESLSSGDNDILHGAGD